MDEDTATVIGKSCCNPQKQINRLLAFIWKLSPSKTRTFPFRFVYVVITNSDATLSRPAIVLIPCLRCLSINIISKFNSIVPFLLSVSCKWSVYYKSSSQAGRTSPNTTTARHSFLWLVAGWSWKMWEEPSENKQQNVQRKSTWMMGVANYTRFVFHTRALREVTAFMYIFLLLLLHPSTVIIATSRCFIVSCSSLVPSMYAKWCCRRCSLWNSICWDTRSRELLLFPWSVPFSSESKAGIRKALYIDTRRLCVWLLFFSLCCSFHLLSPPKTYCFVFYPFGGAQFKRVLWQTGAGGGDGAGNRLKNRSYSITTL